MTKNNLRQETKYDPVHRIRQYNVVICQVGKGKLLHSQ